MTKNMTDVLLKNIGHFLFFRHPFGKMYKNGRGFCNKMSKDTCKMRKKHI